MKNYTTHIFLLIKRKEKIISPTFGGLSLIGGLCHDLSALGLMSRSETIEYHFDLGKLYIVQ